MKNSSYKFRGKNNKEYQKNDDFLPHYLAYDDVRHSPCSVHTHDDNRNAFIVRLGLSSSKICRGLQTSAEPPCWVVLQPHNDRCRPFPFQKCTFISFCYAFSALLFTLLSHRRTIFLYFVVYSQHKANHKYCRDHCTFQKKNCKSPTRKSLNQFALLHPSLRRESCHRWAYYWPS